MRTHLLATGLLLAALPAWAQTAPAAPVQTVAAAAAPRISLDPANRDPKVQPCDDFFEHATGGWRVQNPLPPSEPRWGSFNVLADGNLATMRALLDELAAGKDDGDADFKRIGAFWKSCMDEATIDAAGVKPIAAELAEIAAVKDRKGVDATIRSLHAQNNPVLFAFGQEPDAKNTKRTLASLSQSGLSLPNRDYYTRDDDKAKKTRDALVAHVEKMMVLAGDAPEQAKQEAAWVMAIETALAKASKTPVELRDPLKNYKLVKQADLAKYAPSIDWAAYYRDAGVSFAEANLGQPEFFKGMDQVLAKTPVEQLVAYLRWHVVRTAANALSKPFVDEAFAMNQNLSGAKELRPRWKRCVGATTGMMPDAVGKAFIAKAVDPGTKERALKLVQNLRATLSEDIQGLDWMQPATKKKAQEKLTAMVEQIVSPEKWIDYSQLNIDPAAYRQNLQAARRFDVKRTLAKIGKAPDRGEWVMSPMVTNAYYEPSLSVIVFPAGILMPPFFDAKADDAVNYGGIGMVIGHEMTHGFDDQGRQYDAKGMLTDWWTKEDAKRYEAKAQCVVDQAGGFQVAEDLKMNGKLVAGEAIADLGGLAIAYRAFQKTEQAKKGEKIDGLTPDQRFFLSFGQIWAEVSRPEYARTLTLSDPHPTAAYRVNGTLGNLPQFQKAFACPADAKMVRKDRCQIW